MPSENELGHCTPDDGESPIWSLLHLLDLGGAVLWVDCGTGNDLTAASESGFHRIAATEADVYKARAAAAQDFDVRTGQFAELEFAPHERFDVVVAPHALRDGSTRADIFARLRSVLEPEGTLVFETAFDDDDPDGTALKRTCRAAFAQDPVLIPTSLSDGSPGWLGSVVPTGTGRWAALVALTQHLNVAPRQTTDVDELERDLADRTRDVARVHGAFEAASAQLAGVLGSRTFRLAAILRDARHSWRMALLAPLRVLWLAVPTRSRTSLRRRLLPLEAALRGTRVRRIRNHPWPADQPLVSVVIPCFNYGRYVEEAVASVARQTFQDFEILVVDGGSDDGETPEALARLEHPRLQLLIRDERHLVGDNRNYGIERARGKYICCLDADDLLAPTYLEKAVFTAETGGYDFVFPSVQCFGRSQVRWLVQDATLESCADENGISTVALFRREAWATVDGFRDFGIGADYLFEDWDFWLRLLASGARAKSIREMLMLYRVHGKGLTATAGRTMAAQGAEIRKANRDALRPEAQRALHRKLSEPVQVVDPVRNLARHTHPTRRHVMFALPFTSVGGADTILLQIARTLVENDVDVTIVTTLAAPDRGGDNSRRFEEITPRVYHLLRFLPDDMDREQFVDLLIESTGVDTLFLVGSDWFYQRLPRLKQRHPGLKVVDQLFNEIGHLASNRKYAKHIDIDVVASEPLRRTLLEFKPNAPEKIIPIIHGVDTEQEFDPAQLDTEDAYRLLPQLRDKFVVTFAGRFSEEKAPLTFLRIAELLWERDDVIFLIIGDGPEADAVEDRIQASGLSRRVVRPGFVDDVRPLLAASDALVIPSRIEGIPIVMLECLSLGVPVVASAVGGIPTVIQDGVAGFLGDPEAPESFADRIEWMLDHPAERSEMSTRARALAREKYSLKRMANEYLRVFGV